MPKAKSTGDEKIEAPLLDFFYPQLGVLRAASQADADALARKLIADLASQVTSPLADE